MATTSPSERSVSRTYRAAIRLGEDFITLEETVVLPIDASDEEVQQAVDLGWRIYRAQREAVEQQIGHVRESQAAPAPIVVRDPDAPASDKQRNYIAALQDDLTWTSEQLTTYAGEHGVDLVTMTKGQASTFIDGLKKLSEERARYSAEAPVRQHAAAEAPARHTTAHPMPSTPALRVPASDKQLQALARIAQTRALDLDHETEERFGVRSDQLSDEQARTLLAEWQARPARNGAGRKAEAAL